MNGIDAGMVTGCLAAVPDGIELASSIVLAPQGRQVLAYGEVKLAIARSTNSAVMGNEAAVVLVRRAPEHGGQRAGDGARAGWSQMDQQLADVGRLLPAGTVPRLIKLPPSADLTAALGSIVDRHPVPDKAHTGACLSWQSECGRGDARMADVGA